MIKKIKKAVKSAGITVFEEKEVRKVWKNNKWYFAVVDIVSILSESSNPRRYWSDLKIKIKEEGYIELYENIVQLKLKSLDGKKYLTDTADLENTFRIIQSISSPKAEPFKRWLAKVGRERIEEIADPELAVNRAKEIYDKKGYPKDWIDKRMRGIAVRNTLTDEWKERNIKGMEYGILTNEIYKGVFEKDYKSLMKLKKLDKKNRDNLRDHMGDVELILTMLAEATSTDISKAKNSKGLKKIKIDVQKGGKIAGEARKKIEKETGKRVISKNNFKKLK